LAKRPYVKHLVPVLIERGLPGGEMDLEKIARECLKHLTSEDLMQLAQSQGQTMSEYERQFTLEMTG
jgi:hypothetical protein